ncbi:MAG: hypothetical protein WBB25_03570 [Sulfitobacter sp.]
MKKISRDVAIATVVFFGLMLLWNGNGFGQEALTVAALNALVFAMIYAAIRVAIVLFRGNRQ